jgi:archaellum biogenesis ATPase FlaH
MFGNYLTNAKTMFKSSTEIDYLITGNNKINEFLSGGFKRGLIYELQGQSLTGKSCFLNSLLYNNFSEGKILFIDTNSSFSYDNLMGHKDYATMKSKIDHIDNIFDFKDLLIYLQDLYTKEELKSYSFIIIDSLSLIANKFTNRDDDIVKEFNNLILSVVSKFNVGFIYTSTCRLKDKILYE